jgi:cellulose biosynthesis protein BcsQ
MTTVPAVSAPIPPRAGVARVLTVSSNKGGVGKTTVASNLAIYFRALREELPVLVIGLDDQHTLDRMFSLRDPRPGDGNLKHAFAERSFDRVAQLGQYGVYFVPSPPELIGLKARAEDVGTLRRMIERTEWDGVVIFDTKSDLEALTQNALVAAHRVLIPVSDWASLEEAAKIFAFLERVRPGHRKARVLLTLADLRIRIDEPGHDLRGRLEGEVRARGWPIYSTMLTRSPRVEALNSATGRPLSILHHASGTPVHRQFRELAEEVLEDLGLGAADARSPRPADTSRRVLAARAPEAESPADWKDLFLRSLRRIAP